MISMLAQDLVNEKATAHYRCCELEEEIVALKKERACLLVKKVKKHD